MCIICACVLLYAGFAGVLCLYNWLNPVACGDQKRGSNPLEVELQAVVGRLLPVLGTECGSLQE